MDQIPCRLLKLFKAGFSPVNVILQALSICLQEKRHSHSAGNTAEKIPVRIRALAILWSLIFPARKLDDDKHHSKITALSYFTSPFPSFSVVFPFFFFFVLFALPGNKLPSVCLPDREVETWTSLSPSSQQGCSGVTWSCCLQGWFDSGLTLIFAGANWVADATLNSWSEKLHQLLGFSCYMKLKQLWDLRKIAWIHPQTRHLWDRTRSSLPSAHQPTLCKAKCWWKGDQPVPSCRW